MAHKKHRPHHAPESYLSKVFVLAEKNFDFGPILVGKDPEQRSDERIQMANSSRFRISNTSNYDLKVSFALASCLFAEPGQAASTPFIVEPETMELKVDQTEELTVWAFPEEGEFRD
jgi:hydrocephalus-inducing protein